MRERKVVLAEIRKSTESRVSPNRGHEQEVVLRVLRLAFAPAASVPRGRAQRSLRGQKPLVRRSGSTVRETLERLLEGQMARLRDCFRQNCGRLLRSEAGMNPFINSRVRDGGRPLAIPTNRTIYLLSPLLARLLYLCRPVKRYPTNDEEDTGPLDGRRDLMKD
jgi:hypothetical protein